MDKLHYNLDFLNIGGQWFPKEDLDRLTDYKFMRELFELSTEDFIHKIFPTGLVDIADYTKFVHCNRLLPYPRLLTLKTADMVMGQVPSIMAQGNNDDKTEKIKDLLFDSDLFTIFKKGIIDYSRFGVMILRVFKERGKAKICAWDPREWVPVYYEDGTLRIHYNVIGWKSADNTKLFLQIHDTETGAYEERECSIDNDGTILSINKSTKISTNGKCMLFAITNTPTTTNPLGTSDYSIIAALMQKAIERLTAILRVLDEHADPSMTGPHSLLEKTDNGELIFKTSKYYAIGEDEQKPEYLVWNANLDSSFKAFDELMAQIYILSEMGSAFLGADKGTGNVVSGTSMRFKMVSPLEKARRIQSDMTRPLKDILSVMLSIENVDLKARDINITWKDCLPRDPRELAELAKLEAGSKSIKPLLHAIMDNYDMDEQTAQHYVEGIIDDQKKFGTGELSEDVVASDNRSLATGQTKGSLMNPASEENVSDEDKKALK